MKARRAWVADAQRTAELRRVTRKPLRWARRVLRSGVARIAMRPVPPPSPAGRLITAVGGRDGGRIFLLVDGAKRWILSPAVFRAHGWSLADVETLDAAEIEAIPTSPIVIGEESAFAPIQEARLRASGPFLRGRGIEIGAGLNPQRLPAGVECERFDLREAGELARIETAGRGHDVGADQVPSCRGLHEIASRFPSGADFLIAHNVLEHCADPIGTLHDWCGYVRSGGVLVLSVPHRDHCPDAGRLVPDFEHLLADHLLGRDADHFESREHAYSCSAGWMNSWPDWRSLDRRAIAERMHAVAAMPALDVHWHAFTPRLFDELLQTASLLAERPLHLIAWADPERAGAQRTVGDVIAVVRVGRRLPGDPALEWQASDVGPRVRAFAAQLMSAARRLENL